MHLNRAALAGLGLKGLPVKTDALAKASAAAAAMDDFAESGRKLVKLGEMPAVDLTVDTNAASIGENLEADEDEDDNTAVNSTDVIMKSAEDDDDEDDIDPLDAFMTDVNQEVKKVNAQDRSRMKGGGARMPVDGAAEGEEDDDDEVPPAPDELDTADMRPEDILAYGSFHVCSDHTFGLCWALPQVGC